MDNIEYKYKFRSVSFQLNLICCIIKKIFSGNFQKTVVLCPLGVIYFFTSIFFAIKGTNNLKNTHSPIFPNLLQRKISVVFIIFKFYIDFK